MVLPHQTLKCVIWLLMVMYGSRVVKSKTRSHGTRDWCGVKLTDGIGICTCHHTSKDLNRHWCHILFHMYFMAHTRTCREEIFQRRAFLRSRRWNISSTPLISTHHISRSRECDHIHIYTIWIDTISKIIFYCAPETRYSEDCSKQFQFFFRFFKKFKKNLKKWKKIQKSEKILKKKMFLKTVITSVSPMAYKRPLHDL